MNPIPQNRPESIDDVLYPIADVIDLDQVVYALERARDRLQAEADRLSEQLDYGAEFPFEDAQRMREAIVLLRANRLTGEGKR